MVEVCVVEIRACEVCVVEDRVVEIRVVEIRVSEDRFDQIRAYKVRLAKLGAVEVRPNEVDWLVVVCGISAANDRKSRLHIWWWRAPIVWR